ncbi:MAG: hypothetical protein EU547_01145 [Promethearchaeota archaeon]|nr:MAG: hypothetical protein EU547_01145 [Candidatus Lokiarchaeota archaeon]
MSEDLNLKNRDYEAIKKVETIIGKSIPVARYINSKPIGMKIKDGSVLGLALSNCNLKRFPKEIYKLDSLEILNLSNNDLGVLPDSIENLKSIKSLNLEKNSLRKIPDSFGNLIMLQELYLNFNNIENLPESFKKLNNLVIIELIENPWKTNLLTLSWYRKYLENKYSIEADEAFVLEELNDHIITSPKIRKGNIFFGIKKKKKHIKSLILKDIGLTKLPKSFGNLKHLEELFLRFNNFTNIPYSIWPLKKLKNLDLYGNPLDNQSKNMLKNRIPVILEFCRERASINIFISHAVDDYNYFHIKEVSNYLEMQDEIYEAFYCEEDLIGNIEDFMNEKIPKSQLLLFFASEKSINSSIDCKHELELAKIHDIQIIPIKGENIDWDDLKEINLSREIGKEFNDENIHSFCEDLYDYIKKFKREINLYDFGEGKLDKQIMNIKMTINNYFESPKIKEKLNENLNQIEEIFQKFSDNEISPIKYIQEIFNQMSGKSTKESDDSDK